MKKLFVFLLLSSLLTTVYTQTIKGVVSDKHSQYTLPGASVVRIGSDTVIGTSTDAFGEFRLEGVPLGRQSIQVSFIGYEAVIIPNLMVLTGKEVNVEVQLIEKVSELEEVVISTEADKRESLNKMATVSTRTISIEEAGKYAGSTGDPARMAQNYAGVSGANDARNDIIIRGNSPTGVLWRMEGIDITSPNHFSSLGTTGGPVSMLNLNNLSNSDFMTSAWSAEYGNALSGVFDLQLRDGNRDKHEHIFQVGFNGFELGSEGPFVKGKRASYILNYRYSTLAVMSALGMDLGVGTAVPQYQDLTFKVNIPTEKAGRFSLFGIGGISYIEFDTDTAEEDNLYFAPNTQAKIDSKTGIAGISHKYFFNENTYSKLVLSVSGTKDGTQIDTLNNGVATRFFGQTNQQLKYSANYKLNKKFNARNTFTIGAIYDQYNFSLVDSVLDGNSYTSNTNYSDGTSLIQGYLQWQHRFNDAVTLNAGLHVQYLTLNESSAIEPRLGLRYKVSDKHTFNLGAGMHSQMQMVIAYFWEEEQDGTIVLPNKDLGFTKSMHSVFGHDFLMGKDLRLKTEVYYQYLYDVPVDTFSSSYSMLNQGANFGTAPRTGLVNEGIGYNYGIEFTLEKFLSRGYYFLLTASLFESEYEASDERLRNSTYNTNFTANALGGKEFSVGKKSNIGIDLKLTYAGGRRETPIDLELSRIAGEEVRIDSKAYSVQNDPYFRTDVKLTYRMNQKKISHLFSVDLQNITNQKNVFLNGYNSTTGEIGTTYQRGFYPDITYKLWF